MESRVKILGHPVHPMLIVFPVGLFTTAVIFNVLYLVNDNPFFPTASFYMSGQCSRRVTCCHLWLIDWLGLPNNSRAKAIGDWHGIGNVVVTALFAASWLVRNKNVDFMPDPLALIISFAGAAIAMITAWIGGELVYRLGVGLDPGANVNAPNSLSEKRATSSLTAKRPVHR